LVEFFRGDYPVHYLGGWATPAQVVSIVILAAGLILLGVLPRMTHRYPDTTQKPSHQPR
jgi:hypothetical protein